MLEKNADLEALVDYLATDLDTAQLHVRGLTRVVDHLRQQRRTAVLGDHLQLTRIRELEQELRHDRAAWQSVEQSMLAKIKALEMELSDAYRKSYSRDASTPPTTQEQPKEQNPHDDPTLLQVDRHASRVHSTTRCNNFVDTKSSRPERCTQATSALWLSSVACSS